MSFLAFNGLNALNLMGNGISEWGEEKALTHRRHPLMHHLGFLYNDLSAYINSSILPPGVLNPDFPTHLLDIFVCACELMDLPLELESIWSDEGTSLVLIGNAFIKVPDALLRMDLRLLNLDLNNLRVIPVELLGLKSLRWLSVLGNPIAAFPRNVKVAAALAIVNFDLTNETWLPDWMRSIEFLDNVSMYGSQSPLCLDTSADTALVRSHLNCRDPPILILEQIKNYRAEEWALTPIVV